MVTVNVTVARIQSGCNETSSTFFCSQVVLTLSFMDLIFIPLSRLALILEKNGESSREIYRLLRGFFMYYYLKTKNI